MSFTLVQRAPASGVNDFAGGQSPANRAFGSNVTAGNLLIAYYEAVDPSATETLSITDTLGNSWTLLFSKYCYGNIYYAAWFCVANASGADTIHITGGSNAYQNGVILAEFNGPTLLDQVSTPTNWVASGTLTSGAITTTHADELILSFGATVTGFAGGTGGSIASPMALAVNGGWSYSSNYWSAQMGYKVVSSIQTGFAAVMDSGGSTGGSIVVASFYASGGGEGGGAAKKPNVPAFWTG